MFLHKLMSPRTIAKNQSCYRSKSLWFVLPALRRKLIDRSINQSIKSSIHYGRTDAALPLKNWKFKLNDIVKATAIFSRQNYLTYTGPNHGNHFREWHIRVEIESRDPGRYERSGCIIIENKKSFFIVVIWNYSCEISSLCFRRWQYSAGLVDWAIRWIFSWANRRLVTADEGGWMCWNFSVAGIVESLERMILCWCFATARKQMCSDWGSQSRHPVVMLDRMTFCWPTAISRAENRILALLLTGWPVSKLAINQQYDFVNFFLERKRRWGRQRLCQ